MCLEACGLWVKIRSKMTKNNHNIASLLSLVHSFTQPNCFDITLAWSDEKMSKRIKLSFHIFSTKITNISSNFEMQFVKNAGLVNSEKEVKT